ncbi:restriction endonuclease subunit S [Lewinella cohaerens]|uniref:restriction endonuclease subunit S n=1 Tax=Lewinella cohaerens TaxID=70995 RepID=UPI000363EBF3|nr:restriction endonuclease subunit S [Lewinella cohaerens]
MTNTTAAFKFLQIIPFDELQVWDVKRIITDGPYFNYPKVKFEKVLSKANIEWVEIENGSSYPILGVRSQGQGVYINRISQGSELRMKKYQKSKEFTLFYCKVRTVNGQWGIVFPEFSDTYSSSNFRYLEIDKNLLDPRYLELLLKLKKLTSEWDKYAIGADGRHFPLKTLMSLQIPLPSIEEQERMVSLFNAKINQANKLITEAQSLDNKLDQKLGITTIESDNVESGKLTFIDFKEIEQWGLDQIFKTINKYDTLYEVTSVQLLCNVGSGGTPRRSISRYYKGDIPWIKTGEVLDDIIYDTEEKITKEAVSNSSAKIYPKGSLLMAMYGQGKTRGRTAKLGIDATTNQACAVLYNIKNDLILTDYLWVYLMNEYDRIRELASGNNQPNLNADMVKNYPVVLPPLPIQARIVDFFFKIKEEIKKNKSEAENIKEQSLLEFENTVFQTVE